MPIWVVVYCGLVGWWPPRPLPKPDPPIPLEGLVKNAAFGFIGGALGGYLVYFALGLSGPLASVDFIPVTIGAGVLGRIFQMIGELIWPTP